PGRLSGGQLYDGSHLDDGVRQRDLRGRSSVVPLRGADEKGGGPDAGGEPAPERAGGHWPGRRRMRERQTGAAHWNGRGAGGTQGCRGAEKAGAMAGDGPLISVIIPVYRVEAYLEDCVRSVQRQTWQKLQIILVDDGSPDGCGALCDRLAKEDPRIEVIH